MPCNTRNSDNRYQVGTSGYMVSKKKWLSLPCLNCIEINSSFYRLPSKVLINALSNLPDNVNVVMKASKYLTHTKRLKDPKESWGPFWQSVKPLNAKLACVLVQLPPSFTNNSINVARLIALHSIVPEGLRVAVEFRDASWLVDDIYVLFSKLKWAVVGTYIVKKPSSKWVGSMPNGLYIPPATCSYNYLRVHGKRGWKGELSEQELLKIRNTLGKQSVQKSFVMFNNSFFDNRSKTCKMNGIVLKSAAVCNAIKFSETISVKKTRRFRKASTV
jgi:uncharacterized protein YecE (DUF72 family)